MIQPVPLIILNDLQHKTYVIDSNFATDFMVYNHDTMMLVVDKNIVIRAFELRMTKNKRADALDVQCWYDDEIAAIITVRYKKQIPILLHLIADRGKLKSPE